MKISTRICSFDREHFLFTCDASELRGNGDRIDLESHVTGRILPFLLANVVEDREGDLIFMDYRCVSDLPSYAAFKLRVYND